MTTSGDHIFALKRRTDTHEKRRKRYFERIPIQDANSFK
jgi:hypothetical protein